MVAVRSELMLAPAERPPLERIAADDRGHVGETRRVAVAQPHNVEQGLFQDSAIAEM
jgi:hypothetical protein